MKTALPTSEPGFQEGDNENGGAYLRIRIAGRTLCIRRSIVHIRAELRDKAKVQRKVGEVRRDKADVISLCFADVLRRDEGTAAVISLYFADVFDNRVKVQRTAAMAILLYFAVVLRIQRFRPTPDNAAARESSKVSAR